MWKEGIPGGPAVRNSCSYCPGVQVQALVGAIKVPQAVWPKNKVWKEIPTQVGIKYPVKLSFKSEEVKTSRYFRSYSRSLRERERDGI